MADSAKRLLGPTLLTGAATTLYTVPGATQTIVRHIHVSNNHTAAVTLTLSIGTDAAATRIYDAFSIPPNGALDWAGFMVLEAAEIIQGWGSTASKLAITASGVEIA